MSRVADAAAAAVDRIDDALKGADELNLTEGGIATPLFYLSLPIVVTNLLQVAYNLADTFWLGQFSTEALAAISFAFPMVFLLISLGMGLAVAGSVTVAQATGAGDEREAQYAASQTVMLSLVAAVLLGAVGYVGVEHLLAFLGASPAVLPLATEYMRLISLGLVFMFGFFVFISLMRGYGDTVTPMLVMFGSVAVNVAIDPFLIFGWGPFPRLGVAGAAVATVFSRALALAVGLWLMFTGRRGVEVNLADMRPDPAYARKLVGIGLPASVEGVGRALSINLLLLIVGGFSTTVVAAFGIGARVFSVVFLPAIAVARGVETMTGQNIGAGKPDRAAAAARVAAIAMFAGLSLLGAATWVLGDRVVALFTTDPAVVEVGATFLRYVAPTFGMLGIMRSYNGSLRGAGRTTAAAAIAISTLGVVRLPTAWLLAGTSLGPDGVWLSFPVSNVLGAALAYAWYRRGTWRDADVTAGPGGPPGAVNDGDDGDDGNDAGESEGEGEAGSPRDPDPDPEPDPVATDD